MQAKALLI